MTQPAATSSVSPTRLNEATINQPITRPKEFKGRFTVENMQWKPEYADVKSNEYKTLKASLETELNSALEYKISGFVMCVVQWFNKGSVITHFAVYVSETSDLTSDKLHTILLGALSLANFTLENITVEQEQGRDEKATEETETFLKWELWKIVSLGGLLIVFILLLCILGLMVSTTSLILIPQFTKSVTQARDQVFSLLG